MIKDVDYFKTQNQKALGDDCKSKVSSYNIHNSGLTLSVHSLRHTFLQAQHSNRTEHPPSSQNPSTLCFSIQLLVIAHDNMYEKVVFVSKDFTNCFIYLNRSCLNDRNNCYFSCVDIQVNISMIKRELLNILQATKEMGLSYTEICTVKI